VDGDVIRKMVARGFRIGDEVRGGKISPIRNFQARVYIFVDHYRHPLGIEEDTRDLAVGVVSLFDSLGDLVLRLGSTPLGVGMESRPADLGCRTARRAGNLEMMWLTSGREYAL
jgi:hypothetical protein